MKKINTLKLGLFALLTCASTSAFGADDSLQIHGYAVVAGNFQAETDKTNLSLHRDPNGDPRGKLGDLGNSYWHDYFTALSLNKKWEGKDGAWADYNYELVTYGNKTVEAGQNYARFGGLSFLPKDSEIWAGRRNFSKRDSVFAYNLKDVGIDSGVGYTSKNLDITLGSAQAVWSGSTVLAYSRNIVDAAYRVGAAEVGATYVAELKDGSAEPKTAVSLYGSYNMNKFLGVMPGNTMVMAQFGKGVIAQYLNTNRMETFSNEEDTSMRLTVNGLVNVSKNLSVNPSLILEQTNRKGDREFVAANVFHHGNEDETAVMAGVNATQKINNNVSMLYEANINKTENLNGADNVDGMSYKIAAGPAIQLETMPWVRPMLKLTASYIGGDKEITGLKKDSEVRFGYQMEAWF